MHRLEVFRRREEVVCDEPALGTSVARREQASAKLSSSILR
jgi:hypothetical protein